MMQKSKIPYLFVLYIYSPRLFAAFQTRFLHFVPAPRPFLWMLHPRYSWVVYRRRLDTDRWERRGSCELEFVAMMFCAAFIEAGYQSYVVKTISLVFNPVNTIDDNDNRVP